MPPNDGMPGGPMPPAGFFTVSLLLRIRIKEWTVLHSLIQVFLFGCLLPIPAR